MHNMLHCFAEDDSIPCILFFKGIFVDTGLNESLNVLQNFFKGGLLGNGLQSLVEITCISVNRNTVGSQYSLNINAAVMFFYPVPICYCFLFHFSLTSTLPS